MKKIFLIFIVFGIIGCASVQEMNANLNSLYGMKIDRAITILGIGDPTNSIELENRRVYVWQSSGNMSLPMGGYNYGSDQYGNSVATWDPNQSSSQIPLNCKITINTTKDFVIIDSFVEGDGIQCNAYNARLKNAARFLQKHSKHLEPTETSPELLHIKDGIKYLGASQTPFSGRAAQYFENGQAKARIEYKNGLKHGMSQTFYDNGQIRQSANYKNGERHGVIDEFSMNGERKAYFNYQNGKKLSAKSFFDTGELKTEFMIADEWEATVSYFKSGQKKQVLFKRDGVIDGPRFEFNEDGSILKGACYRNGEQVDTASHYCQNFVK